MGNQDIFSTPSLIDNVGAPFILGLTVGYFVKKMLRIALFLSGGIVVILFIAEYYGVVNITDTQLLHATDIAASAAKDSSDFLLDRLSRFTVKGVSATGGFVIGFKMG
ncbi:MAG: FUN14 domain-containing protein [Methylococcales bacterium]|nr:FUN14 domain-containing protein [Methylococcales bacterium]